MKSNTEVDRRTVLTIILWFVFIFSIAIFYFGHLTWSETPYTGCDWWLENAYPYQEAAQVSFQACKDDYVLGKSMMVLGGLLIGSSLIMLYHVVIGPVRLGWLKHEWN